MQYKFEFSATMIYLRTDAQLLWYDSYKFKNTRDVAFSN